MVSAPPQPHAEPAGRGRSPSRGARQLEAVSDLYLTRIESVSMTFCNSDWRSGECCRLQLGAQLAEYLGPFPAPHTLTPNQRTPQKPSIRPNRTNFCRSPEFHVEHLERGKVREGDDETYAVLALAVAAGARGLRARSATMRLCSAPRGEAAPTVEGKSAASDHQPRVGRAING